VFDVVLHSGLDLPLATETAKTVLGVGLFVVAVVAYDAYQQRST
jgi:hypothetical protein